jgi:hypothetical protein
MGSLVVENLDDLPAEIASPRIQVEVKAKVAATASEVPTSRPSTLKQAELNVDEAIYTNGVYKYSINDKDGVNDHRQPKLPARRPATAPHSNNNNPNGRTAINQSENNQEGQVFTKRPTTGNQGTNFHISGLGYDDKGKLRDGVEEGENRSPSNSPKRRNENQEYRQYHTNRVLKNTQKYFEYQDRDSKNDYYQLLNKHQAERTLRSSPEALKNGKALNIAGSQITPLNPWDGRTEYASSPEASPKRPANSTNTRPATSPTDPSTNNKESTGDHLEVNVEDDDQEITFGVNVKKSPKDGKKMRSLKEVLLFEREMARTAKETAKKENYLLKELKKLGVDINNIDLNQPNSPLN